MGVASHPKTAHHARLLDHAAHLLDQARDPSSLAWAMQNNLAVWMNLKAAADDHALPERERDRVEQLADHVIRTTLNCGRIAPNDSLLEGFINMNKGLARALSDEE